MPRKYKVKSIDVVDWEVNSVIEGVILDYETMKVKDDDRLTMVIDTGQTKARVWHSKALEEAFSLGVVGDNIRIEFKGKVPISGGHTFNRFSVAVWTGVDDEKKEALTEKADG